MVRQALKKSYIAEEERDEKQRVCCWVVRRASEQRPEFSQGGRQTGPQVTAA